MPSSLESLYRQIKGFNSVGNTYGEFQKQMADAGYRKGLYNALSKSGANVGKDLGEFESKLGYGYVATPKQEKGPSETPQIPSQSDYSRMSGFDKTVENIQKYQQERGKQPVQIGVGGNVVKTDNGYLTVGGHEYDNPTFATQSQMAYDDAARRELHPVETDLRDAYAEKDRLNKEMEKIQGKWVDADGNVHYGNRGNDESVQYLKSAMRQNEKRITAIEAERADKGQTQFWQGFMDTAKDPSTWSFGLTDLENAAALSRIKSKMDSGKELSDAEKALLQQTYMNNTAQSKYGSNRGALYRFGGISMQALPFIGEFMLTGGYSALTKAGAKGGTALASKLGAKGIGKTVMKNLGIAAGDVAAGAAMANTTGAMRTFSDVMGRHAGNVTMDEKGDYKFEGGKSLGRSIYEAEVANTLEYYTEKLGEHMKLGKGLAEVADRYGLKKLSKAINYASSNKWLERGGVQDYPSEVIEEEANLVLNSILVGDNSLSDLDPRSQTQMDIWGGMAFSIGLMQSPRFINSGRKYAGYKLYENATNTASKNAEDVFSPDKWEVLKEKIDNTDNQNISDVLSSVVTSDMSQQQKEATMYYADSLLKMRGYNTALMNDIKANGDNAAQRGMDESYMMGYNAQSPEQMEKIESDAATAAASLQEFGPGFATWVMDPDNNPQDVLNTMTNNPNRYTDRQIKAAMDFYTADSAHRGMEDAGAASSEAQKPSSDARISYTTREQNASGKHVVNSFDKDGNLIGSEEFDEKDDADAYMGRLKMEQQMRSLNDYLNTEEARRSQDAIMAFEEENGWEPGTIAELAASDPYRMSDAEWMMADKASEFLKGLAYPSDEVHVNTSRQDGVETADKVIDKVISPIEPINPQDNEGKAIVEQWGAAQQARNEAFGRNEDLMQEVTNMEQAGLMPQEILSSLDTFSPQDRQIITDYYNARAQFEGYMSRAQQKIDEVAAENRKKNTFKGTINGQPAGDSLIYITDGQNQYTLIGGNISTNSQGQVTGSDSGLIIVLDQNGDYISLPDDATLSVISSGITMDQYEESERQRLQQEVTLVSDPNGAMMQQEEQGGNLENVGGEASAEMGTGADNPPTAAPAEQQINIPVDEKTGVKLYERGVPIDQTIDDLKKDGHDIVGWSDLAIGEAQGELNKMKQPKTRAELIRNEARVKELQGIIDYYNKVKGRWEEMNRPATPANSEENVNVQPEQNKVAEKAVNSQQNPTVEEQKQQRIAEAKAKYGELFDDDFTKANDVYELVSMWVGRKRNLAWDDVNGKRGLQKELGWTRKIGGDTKYIETLLAKNGEGMGVDEFAHMVWESPENSIGEEKRWSTEEIKDAMLELLKSAQSKSDVVDYALNTRIAQAETTLQEQQQRAKEEEAEQKEVIEPLTDEELRAIESNLPFAAPSEGEDISESPITQLISVIAELQQQEGMPEIKLVDTGRMSDDKWYDITSQMYDGAFVSQEDVDDVRDYILEQGVFYNPGIGITVYSDGQTAEEVKYKVETINSIINGKEDGELGAEVVQRHEDRSDAEEAAETGEEIGKKSESQPADDYLTPRNEEEKAIIQGVIDDLQKDIQDAVDEQSKARAELEKARVKESDRATDMFANDDSFAEPDAIFSQEEMGFDTSVEGVERRTSAQQEKLQEATNRLNQLQSPEERDSRIRGALDNYRRQTSIGFEEETPSVSSDIKTPSQQKAYLEAKQEIFDYNMTEEQIVKESDELAGRIQEFENDRTGFRDRLIARKRAFDDALERIRIKNKERQKEVEEQSPFKVGEEVEMKHTNKKMKVVSINRDGTLNLVNDTLTTTPIREDNVDPSKIKKKQKEQPKQEYAPTWQYNFHYDKNTKHVRIDREDVSGPIPIGDGRWHLDANSLAEMRGILENPKNNLAEVYKEVEASLHNAEVGEQLRNESDPVEAIEQAAKSFKQEQEKKAYGAENKLVSQDRYEELKKRMKAKLLGQLNAGVDPEIMAIGAEMAMYHIEAGARKFSDYATRMISDLGDSIRPYLKAFYESARRMPGMEELSRGMDATDVVDNFDILNYDKQPATTVNEHKQEDNDTENVVSSQQESVPEEQQEARLRFVSSVRRALLLGLQKGEKPFRNINDLRNLARNEGMEVDADGRDDILLQELVEDAIVGAARDVVEPELGEPLDRSDYDLIVKLYEMQPTIGARSSNRIKMQQYSTPLPMSYVADMMVEGALKVLEPTAGNGMMVIALPADTVFVNELDQTRLDNLRRQGFAEVTNQDATEPFSGGLYDAIVANPPFGSAEAKDYDGKMITGLAEQIALNALSKMKDDGKAVIIIGGKTEYAANGSIKNNKPFFTYLYDHYNVKGVIEMDGKLYAKQGTTYPTRMIVIDGRRSEEERAQSKVYPPTIAKAVGMKANTFEELYDIAERIKNEKSKTNGNEVLRTSTGIALPDNNDAPGNTDRSGRDGQSGKNEPNGERTEPRGSNQGSKETSNKTTARNSGRSTMGVQQPGIPGLFDSQEAASEPQPQSGGSREGGSLVNNGRNGSADVQGSGTADSGVGLNTPQNPKETPKSNIEQAPAEPVKPKVDEKRELTTDKLSYRPHNTAYSLESVAPAAMVEAMDNMLSKIEKEHGNIDTFVTRELGYDSIEEMHNALAAEQVDSVAMAIYQMKQGQGMIIGDQTGVGKGRQMAALIRWACRQGKKPVFITQKADLFSDIYRDLVDIGSGELRPFIFNSDGAMVDNNGVVVHKPLPAKAQASVFAGSKLPAGYDFTVLTYSQVNTGDKISRDETKQAAKEKNERYQERKRKGGERATPKATFLRALAKDNYMFLDESHTAAGKSNTGAYFQSILKDAEAVTFASATFAKRPDTMPMYALRTAMSKAKVKTDELIDIIANGGVTLQEIMSRALTQAGQMVRRERDMSDVVTDWKTVDDPETVKKARQNYDSTIEAFNAIIDFQKNWVVGYLDRLSHDLADVASSAGMRQGTEDLGISNVPFASKTYNYTKQLMLALKVDAIVDEVVKEIEAGRHPVIALENTMGSLLSEYSPGDVIEDTTFAASLLKGLKGVLRYTIKDEDGKEIQKELKPSDLGPDGEAAYHDVEDLIRESTAGIFISPLDAITEKLQQKGYKVGELTGRNEMAVLDENTGEYKVQRRTDKDKKKLARDFNSGALDVLILNKSASTGISLHASEKFSDQRQRTMIIAQPLADINDYMQMIGRIDRTGQVARGYYINLGLPVPAEGRFLMMLSTKLKSLNANTTTSQENESNDVEAPDLLNKYGSQVVVEYLRDNPDIYIKMGEPLKHDNSRITASQLDSYVPSEDDARKVTGYVALLPTNEQDAFYNDVVRRYTELIKYLNDTGSNDLKISVLPLRARTIDKQISSEGSDPSGNNPFAGHAYVEWVDMDVLKKPMKAAEINKVIEQLNPEGKESVKKILDTVEKEYQAKMDKEQSRYDTAKAKTGEAIKEQTEKINKSKRTPEQKAEAIGKFKIDKMQSLEETHNNMVNKIDASRGRLEKPIRDFEVGDSYLVPDDLTTETFFGASPAIFCGFKAKDEGITPSTTLAVFCTLDGRRKIEVKLSDWGALARIKNHTEQNWDAAHEVSLDNWDSQIPSESRKHGYIMTGNILQAFADAGDGGRVPGQLVTYTDIDGNVHDGILMNQHWEPSDLKGSSAPLKTRMEEIRNLPNGDHITSEDGNVVIGRSYQIYTLSVPKSKKIGAQYYENVRLLNAVYDSYFYPYRGQLRADIAPENIEEVVNILSDLGVQVKSDNQVKFDNVTEMGQAQANGLRRMITSHDPMEAINQASESWRRERKVASASSQKAKEVADFINGIQERFGVKGGSKTYVINSIDDIEALRETLSDSAIDVIKNEYNDPDVPAAYLVTSNVIVIFGEKVEDVRDAEIAYWHEQAHSFWNTLPVGVRDIIGEACFNFLERNYPLVYKHIKNSYSEDLWHEEACSYLIGEVVAENGTERLLNNNFEGNEIICNFANRLRNFIKYDEQERNNQLRQDEIRQGSEISRRRETGRERERSSLRPKEKQVTDPLKAIDEAARLWKRDRSDAVASNDTPDRHSAKALYNDRLNRVETVFTEAYQDALVSLKTAQNAIAGDKDIPDSQNAYMAENLMHGKNKNEQDLFNQMFRDPLINTINRIMNLTGMNWGDIDRYVYTKSGLERNREFFMRDWLEGERKRTIHNYEELSPEGQDIYDKMANTIETMFEDGDIESEVEKNKKLAMALQKAHQLYVDSIDNQWQHLKTVQYQDLKDGLSDYRQYLGSMTDFIQKRIDGDYNPSEHDYSGFRAMYGDENGEYNDEDIINELMDTESGIGDINTDTIWNQINNATRYGLERYREAGMRSDEQIDRVEQMFNFYVPMRGFKDSTGEDMYQYFTSKGNSKSYVGGLLKQAKGRGSEANYPISTIFAMTYKAIADCNQNLVNQKLYRLCQANPNDLVILSDSWAVYNDALDIWEETAPEIPEDASEEDVRQITLAWEDRMNDLAKEKKAVKIKGRGMLDYKPMDKKKQSEHIVDVRISGQPRKMIVTANPRMAQALNGQLRFERGDNVFSRWNAAIKNFMASVFTSYSPTFALRNMMRDWTHFRTMLGVREGEGYAKQASKYYRQSLFKMVDLFKRYRDGSLNEDNEMERDFKDFMDNGGITGFVFMQKVDDIQKEMEKLYKQQKDGKTIKLNNKLWDYTLGAIEAVNEGIENNARFATYRASRHYANRTKARSAYDAKEITVNFNRKGAGSKTYGYKSQNKRVEDAAKMFGVTSQVLGEGRIFFNATIQAIATTFKNFQNADGSLNKPYIAKWATRYALPPFMFGFLLPYINQALAAALGNGGDDDPYANLPEWTRRKNLCLYIGNDNFITIPVGQELAAFLALGDIAAGMTYAQDLKPVDRRLDEEMVDVMSTFSPVDMGTKVTKGGIIEDPISEVTGRTFSVLAPLVAVEQNLGWTGRPIYREDKFENDPYTPEYQMVYSGTNPVLVNASKLLHELGGGDDITRGKAEVNPAIIQYLWEQYTGGPGKVFSNTISIGKDAKDILSGNESDFNIRKVEGMKAFISQGDDRTQYYRTQAKYRKYSDDAKKLYHDVKGYEKAAAEDPTSLMKLQNITKGEDYVRMQIVREADKSLSKMNKAVNKAEGSEKKRLRRLYNQQIKEVVDLLDSVGKE